VKDSLNKGRSCVYKIGLHLVFVTKYRKKAINEPMLKVMKDCFSSICEGMECKLLEFNSESDHVHLLVDMSPKVAPSVLVNSLKSVSSRKMRQQFAEHLSQFYWGKAPFWSKAYCAISTGGASLEVVKRYIQNQDAPLTPTESKIRKKNARRS